MLIDWETERRNASPEELLAAAKWSFRNRGNEASWMEFGFELARPDGWKRITAELLRQYRNRNA